MSSDRAITRRNFIAITAATTGSLVTAGFSGRVRATETKALDAAVIGAGLAGLTAARDLARSGLDSFVVLEARDRVGGRTLNQPIAGGYVVEAGGEWVGPTQTAILDLARELELETLPTYDRGKTVYVIQGRRSEVETTTGGVGIPSDLEHEIDILARTIPQADPWNAPRAKEYDATTFGRWLDQKKLSSDDRTGIDIATRLTFGARPEQISFLHFLSVVRSAGAYGPLEAIRGGAQESRIVGGSQLVSLKMAEHLGRHLLLSAPVKKISNWSGAGPVAIETARGSFRARCVIVALMPALATAISFDPPLPQERRNLQDQWPTNGTLMKVHLTYPTPFWRDEGLSGQSFTIPGPYFWSVDNSPPDGSPGALMAFTDGSSLPATEQERKRTLCDAFARCFGKQALNPTAYYEQDWAREKWTRACVSPFPPGVLTRYGPILRSATGSLVWSGTETAEIWAQSMDGAVRSGHRAALQVLESLVRGTS
jgi:monoamine oxidase